MTILFATSTCLGISGYPKVGLPNEGEEQNKLHFFVELGWSLLVPYLTSKGMEEYEAYRAVAWR